MKKLLAASIAAASIAGVSAPAMAGGWSANAGLASEYVFRGVSFGDASAFAGLDYEAGGFYIGTWATSLSDETDSTAGSEYDVYLGYALETDSGFGFNVGATRYEFTGVADFETELNLGFSIAGFGLDIAIGQDHDDGYETADYTFVALSWSGEVFGATWGDLDVSDEDADGSSGARTEYSHSYAEFSAGGEIAGIDTALTIGRKFNIESDGTEIGSEGDDYFIVTASKSFDL